MIPSLSHLNVHMETFWLMNTLFYTMLFHFRYSIIVCNMYLNNMAKNGSTFIFFNAIVVHCSLLLYLILSTLTNFFYGHMVILTKIQTCQVLLIF